MVSAQQTLTQPRRRCRRGCSWRRRNTSRRCRRWRKRRRPAALRRDRRPKAETPNAGAQSRAPLKLRPEPAAAAAPDARHAGRPGFVLNDAQIASIKSRLHLTPDQERMWPAVEAALRNIAYAKARDARPARRRRSTDVASLDPDSAEVQGLKSAAFPLIMSFTTSRRTKSAASPMSWASTASPPMYLRRRIRRSMPGASSPAVMR